VIPVSIQPESYKAWAEVVGEASCFGFGPPQRSWRRPNLEKESKERFKTDRRD